LYLSRDLVFVYYHTLEVIYILKLCTSVGSTNVKMLC
jgi:hypothetical protein